MKLDGKITTACFTRKGCEDYIALNGHNLKSPRIYVESGYRNREWEQLRELVMRLGAEDQPAQQGRQSPWVIPNPFDTREFPAIKPGDYAVSNWDKWPKHGSEAVETADSLGAYGWEIVTDSAIRESCLCRPCEVLLRRIG